MQKKIKTPILLLLLGAVFIHSSYAQENLFHQNIEVSKSETDFLKSLEEKKITRSQFLPELKVNGGFGSEKSNDNVDKVEGPYLFLEGKLNLFRGGQDAIQLEKNNIETNKASLAREVAKRKLRVETFKLLSESKRLYFENELLRKEIKNNQLYRSMALKKVNAGLTTNVDILDFDMKEQNLNNRIIVNGLNIEMNNKKLLALFSNKSSIPELEKEISFNEIKTEKLIPEDSISIYNAKLEHEISKLEKKRLHLEYSPVIDLETRWGQITPQREFYKEKEHQILLNINIPLYTGGTTSFKTQQAFLEASQKERELKQIEIESQTNFNNEQKKIEALETLLQSFEQIYSMAEKYKTLTISEYKRGIKNSSDVISASDKLLEASLKMLETKNELSVTAFSFQESYKKTGEL